MRLSFRFFDRLGWCSFESFGTSTRLSLFFLGEGIERGLLQDSSVLDLSLSMQRGYPQGKDRELSKTKAESVD